MHMYFSVTKLHTSLKRIKIFLFFLFMVPFIVFFVSWCLLFYSVDGLTNISVLFISNSGAFYNSSNLCVFTHE